MSGDPILLDDRKMRRFVTRGYLTFQLHLSHIHDNHPGSGAQIIHQDSLYNSRVAVDTNRRHHYWAMALYSPQDTTLDTVPGIVAHESARRGGELLDIPDLGTLPG